MTLSQYAYRIAGPIDAVIIFVINLAFPLFFLWGRASVPLWAWDGWSVYLVTAGYFVGLLPTISGVFNGINFQRRAQGTAYTPPQHWLRAAIGRGVLVGVTQATVVALVLWLLQLTWPTWTLSWLTISLANAGISAALGYLMQVRGVLSQRYPQAFPPLRSPEVCR